MTYRRPFSSFAWRDAGLTDVAALCLGCPRRAGCARLGRKVTSGKETSHG